MGGGGEGRTAVTTNALWAGFGLQLVFSLLFGRAAFKSRSKTSVIYHLLSLLVRLFVCGSAS